MSTGKVIIEKEQFQLTIQRLSYQLFENYNDFSGTSIIGIQPRGTTVAAMISKELEKIVEKPIEMGLLDITFYRDDFRRRNTPIVAQETKINFSIEGKNVLLIDDVLYTGRTIQAALAALQDFGRPAKVELLTLVDRRFNRNIPIQPDYTGITIDAVDEAYVSVDWSDDNRSNKIMLFPNKEIHDRS